MLGSFKGDILYFVMVTDGEGGEVCIASVVVYLEIQALLRKAYSAFFPQALEIKVQ